MKLIASNKKAFRNYHIIERCEAGIVLEGCEAKSLRQGKCSLDGSFCRFDRDGLIAYNIHVPEFAQAYFKPKPKRERKLLLKKQELKRLSGLMTQKGYTIIPLKIYFNDRGWVKLEIALCKGARKYEKKQKIKDKEVNRDIEREVRRFHKK